MGIPISSLPSATALTGAELIPVVQSGITKQTAISNLSSLVSVKTYGASTSATAADNTLAIQTALDTGLSILIPDDGIYDISDTLYLKKDGQAIVGLSKYNSAIRNNVNSKPILSIGKAPDSVGYRGQYCAVSNLRIIGNAATTEGISVLGPVDDGVSGAARDVKLSNVYISNIGSGFALRVSAWEFYSEALTITGCNKGLLLGSECNASTFVNSYITNCTNEGISMPVAAGGQPAVVEFEGLTVQYCGGTNASIDIGEAYAITMRGLYLEGCTAPANVYFGSGVKNASIDGVMHNLATGTSTRVIRAADVKVLMVKNAVNLGGNIESLVRIEGTLSLSYVSGLFVAAGSVSVNELDDQSTRKATIWNDPLEGRQGVTDFYALTSQSNLRTVDSATGNVLMDFFNGRLYFGAQGAVPNFRRSGTTVALFSDDGTTYGNFRPASLTLGANNVRIFTGANTPEGAQTADVGSLFLRTNGGAGTTLYVKESGTGNTGWVAK